MRLLRPRDPCGRLRRSLAQASKARQPNRAHRQAQPRRACGRRGPRLRRAQGHPRTRRAVGHRQAQAHRRNPARGRSGARAQVQSRRRARGNPRRSPRRRQARARRRSPARGRSRARVQSRRVPQEWVRRPPWSHLRQVRGEPQLRKPPRAQAHNQTQKPRQTQMKHGRVQALKTSQVPGGPRPRHDRTP